MNWIFDHLQLVIAAAGAVAWWLKQHRQAESGTEVKPHKEMTFDDPELAERTRRIREEIQRKIEQRARAYTQPPAKAVKPEPLSPPPLIREVVQRQPELPLPLPKATAARMEAQRTAEILQQQATLEEQLRQAVEMKSAALRRPQFEKQVSSEERAAVEVRGTLSEDLLDPAALRRAFVLREVLGPPVALRP